MASFLQAFLIVQWIVCSSVIILYNKHIMSDLHFPYPATLVLFHMLFTSVVVAAGAMAGFIEVPHISADVWTRGFLPVGLAFAVSLTCLGVYGRRLCKLILRARSRFAR